MNCHAMFTFSSHASVSGTDKRSRAGSWAVRTIPKANQYFEATPRLTGPARTPLLFTSCLRGRPGFPASHKLWCVNWLTDRLDRLLLLLDTGSTNSVRTTAAKQLAQLAAKSVISDVALEDDVKAHRHHQPLGDPSGWTELMAVIARVCR